MGWGIKHVVCQPTLRAVGGLGSLWNWPVNGRESGVLETPVVAHQTVGTSHRGASSTSYLRIDLHQTRPFSPALSIEAERLATYHFWVDFVEVDFTDFLHRALVLKRHEAKACKQTSQQTHQKPLPTSARETHHRQSTSILPHSASSRGWQTCSGCLECAHKSNMATNYGADGHGDRKLLWFVDTRNTALWWIFVQDSVTMVCVRSVLTIWGLGDSLGGNKMVVVWCWSCPPPPPYTHTYKHAYTQTTNTLRGQLFAFCFIELRIKRGKKQNVHRITLT